MLHRINELLQKEVDFAIETTLATKSYVQTIKKAKEKNYNVTLVYFWLNSPELAIERVKARVKEGGHNIPEPVIRRRYKRGIGNLFKLFIPVCDYWLVIDNSEKPYILVAEGNEEEQLTVHHDTIWQAIREISNEER